MDLPPFPSPPTGGCWSQVVQKSPAPKTEEPISSRVFGSCNSSKGISVAVVDANAVIHGDKLSGSADKFVTVAEVLDEVRDPVSRQRLAFLPISVETIEPSADSIKKVVKFARETGDLQTLSDVDLKVIALAYTLETQIHGSAHLREKPPPLRKINVKNLPRTDMPGWGTNVPNLAEWEALENIVDDDGLNNSSRILPLKDISDNVTSLDGISTSSSQQGGDDLSKRTTHDSRLKREIKIEGKKMVADGIDASQGDYGDNPDDWMPAVSRSTHRNYLRRMARCERLEASQKPSEADAEVSTHACMIESNDIPSDGGSECTSPVPCVIPKEKNRSANSSEDVDEKSCEACGISTKLGWMELEPDTEKPLEEEIKPIDCTTIDKIHDSLMVEADFDVDASLQEDEIELCTSELDHLEIASQTDGSMDTSQADENESEQSWAARSLSESTVACVTSDFAMQNVILQIGLRLLVPGGMQIRQLHRWVLKCHACNTVTAEIGRIFCPKCGNGGTLRKVSVTVGENGVILADHRPRTNLRGTKFSIPMPQGGREGITKNFVLREDQLPRKLLYPKAKKKNNAQDFFTADDFFTQTGDKKAPLKPPVGKAISVFIGRRNPNDNHFSRRRH